LPSDDVAVRLRGVARTYRTPTGEVRALRDVTADLPGGVISAVIGPSGSGKSSLLRLIAGLDRPTDGSVQVGGIEIGRASSRVRRAARRSTVGYVFQRPSDNLVPHLDVADHLRLASRGGSLTRDEMLDVAGELGITHRLSHRSDELSGGEQQRAAVAQALASGASLILADEPTAELDSDSAEMVLRSIASLAARGVAFVLATHDPSVMAIADHRLELEHGAVVGTVPSGAQPTDHLDRPLRWPDRRPGGWWPDDEPVLGLVDVDKSYGAGGDTVRAVDGATLEGRSGEVIGLVGRSGSGKTTLLNIAAGWERPDGGTVQRPGGAAPRWSDVAVVPQHLGLMDELSVRENIEYPARLEGRLEERRELIDDLIDRLGLSPLQGRTPPETSLGEQQRTAVARAVVLGPTLIVADEPTAHQDAGWTRAVLRTLTDATLNGGCCVIATHDATVLGSIDRAVGMADGRLEPEAPGRTGR
jgi:ABC-type lipoprotein export system ATPase subunit